MHLDGGHKLSMAFENRSILLDRSLFGRSAGSPGVLPYATRIILSACFGYEGNNGETKMLIFRQPFWWRLCRGVEAYGVADSGAWECPYLV
jgi:hypothetical protein